MGKEEAGRMEEIIFKLVRRLKRNGNKIRQSIFSCSKPARKSYGRDSRLWNAANEPVITSPYSRRVIMSDSGTSSIDAPGWLVERKLVERKSLESGTRVKGDVRAALRFYESG